MRIADDMGRKARALAAWVNTMPGHLPGKLYGAACAQFACRRAPREMAAFTRQNAAALADIRARAAISAQQPPPITPDNTLISVAAHAPSKLHVKRLAHNLRKLCAYSNHIRVYDMPENLTDDAVREIQSARSDIRVLPKSTNALLDQIAFYDSISATLPRYDYYIRTNDSCLITGSLDDFFRMAQEGRADYNAFSLVGTTEGGQAHLMGHVLLLNRAAATAYKEYYEIFAPFVESMTKNCRHPNAVYRRYYLYSMVISAFEVGVSTCFSGCALHSPEQDKRLDGINFYLHNPELFREYLEQRGHPVIKIKQINRREFAYLRKHIPDDLL